jgi:hypothetical protein
MNISFENKVAQVAPKRLQVERIRGSMRQVLGGVA